MTDKTLQERLPGYETNLDSIEKIDAAIATWSDAGVPLPALQLLRGIIDAQAERIKALEGAGWQPIETAPIQPFVKEAWYKDSPKLLLWTDHYCVLGGYGYTEKGKGRWRSWAGNISPTHWMPLPVAPNARALLGEK